MRALTICQPYAEYVANGSKPVENRTWPTLYRGLLAIHAGKSLDWLDDPNRASDYTLGAVVAVALLVDVLPKNGYVRGNWGVYAHLFDHEHANGPWCWILQDVYRLPLPVPCRGAQGLWNLPQDVEHLVVNSIAGYSPLSAALGCKVNA